MKISQIIIKNSINPRKKLHDDIIEFYAEIFDNLPPVIIQKDTSVLIDGFHRIEAAKYLKRDSIEVEEIAIPDFELFAEACRRNSAHGLALTKDERNEAIVKLYKDGWKQGALAQMWGIDHGQISRIVGAKERTEKIKEMCPAHISESATLTPKHEQIIRRAPLEKQDKIAEVVLTREIRPLSVAQTNTLVNKIREDKDKSDEILDHLLINPGEDGIIGTDDEGNIEESAVKQIVSKVKSEPGLPADWAKLMLDIAEFKIKYMPGAVSQIIRNDKSELFSIEKTIDYFEIILTLATTGGSNK